MDRDLQECGTRLEALNDTGNRIGEGVQDDFAEREREQATERTMRGKLEKARQGKVIAGGLPDYGFRFTSGRNGYEVDEVAMTLVRRIFSELASGASVNGVCAALDADCVPPPGAAKNWQRTFDRECAFDDAYAPHTVEELKNLGLSSEVLEQAEVTRARAIP